MNPRISNPQRQEGAILAVVLVMMVVLAFLGIGLLSLATATGNEAGGDVAAVQAFWTAEAGLEQVKAIGIKRKKPFASIVQTGSPSGFLFGTNALSGSTSKGSYNVDVLNDPAWTNAVKALKKYIIVSRATSGGGEKTAGRSIGDDPELRQLHARHALGTEAQRRQYLVCHGR